ncbi:MAG: hypothetical protein PHE56_11495, partial [Bacteroidales bacterium]|nr:hypothetical protein [Bacteroidales bacterium]
NTIKNCRTYGVFLNSTQQTKISGNVIFGCERAIYLNYSNDNIQPPVITSYTNGILSGTALPNSTVEIFGSTGAENANEYLGSVIVDGDGSWSVEVIFNYDYTLASQTSNNFNTSSFASHRLYMLDFDLNCNPENHEPCNMICNGSFSWDDYNYTDPGTSGYGFSVTPNGWHCTHGTSDWCPDHDDTYIICNNVDPSPNLDYIHIWSGNMDSYSRSEGIITKFVGDFILDANYMLSFIVANSQPVDHLYIRLVNTNYIETEINSFISSSPIPPAFSLPPIDDLPSKCTTIYECSFPSLQSDWNDVFVEIHATQEFLNYDGLWIYSTNENIIVGHVYLDDITLYQSSLQYEATVLTGTCIEEGSPIQLSCDDPNAITYNWSGPDEWIGTGAQPIVTASATTANAGLYTVTVVDSNGCEYISSVNVIVNDLSVRITSPITVYPENEVTICPGNDFYLRAAASPNGSYPYPYTFTWNTGYSSESYQNSIINAVDMPAMTYLVTVTDENGCSATSSFTVNYSPVPPVPNPTSNVEHVCSGGSVILSTDQLVGDYEYQWHCDGMYNAGGFSENNYTVTATEVFNNNLCEENVLNWIPIDGHAFFTCQVKNEFGCISEESIMINIDPEITECDYFYQLTNSPVCVGDNIDLDVFADYWSLAESFNYMWYGPNSNFVGSSRHEIVPNASLSDAGYYNVLITTPNGCNGVLSTVVDVIDPGGFVIEQSGSNCEFDNLSLIVSPYYDGLSYSWYGPDGYMGDGYALHLSDITADMSGDYYCNVSNTNGCSFTLFTSVNIDSNPLLFIDEITHCTEDVLGSARINIYSENNSSYELFITLNEVIIYQSEDLNEQFILEYLQSGVYEIAVVSENECVNYYSFLIMGYGCDELTAIGTLIPRTCAYINNSIVRVDICGGAPPYNVSIYHAGAFTGYIEYENSGSYEIELTDFNIYTGAIQLFVLDAADNSIYYYIYGGTTSLAWSPNDVISSEDIQSTYSNRILSIGDATDQTLNIPHNVTFTNCTIYTATHPYTDVSETQWTLAAPFDLILKNCTIQSGCPDQMWQGIVASGACGPQNAGTQAMVVVDGSTISDAMVAVELVHGAIVKASNSKFYNNQYGIFMQPHCNNQSLSYINYNVFETNRMLNNESIFPKAHVKLEYSKNLRLKGNTFSNTIVGSPLLPPDVNYTADKRGKGIEAVFSSFIVTPVMQSTLPLTPFNRNYFHGLYYAIDAQGQSTYAPQINHCEFTNNYRAIHLKATNGARVLYNKIYTTEDNLTVDAVPHVNNGTPQENVTYATYLNGAKNTWFEENKIFNGMAGAYIYNSDDNGGTRYYRNDFGGEIVSNNVINNKGMNAASIVVGKNSNWNAINPPVYITGLEVRCNDYTGNDYAISVLNGNMRKDQGVYQGQTDQLAGNQFHTTMVNGKEFKLQITHGTIPSLNFSQYDLGIYNYYQHDDNNDNQIFHRELNPARIIGVNNNTVLNRTFIESDACPPHFSLNIFDHRTAMSDISVRKNSLAGLQTQYDDVVDNGNTEYMLSLAENLSPHNFKLYVPQLSNDGYISDTVFSTLLKNTTAQKPVIASVLIANSPLPTEIMAKVENSTYLSNGHKNQIRAYQEGINNRVLLEKEISAVQQEIFNIEGELVNNVINNDSISEAVAEVANYFYSKPSLVKSDYVQLFTLQNSIGNFAEASSTLNNLRSYAS